MASFINSNFTRAELLVELNRWNTQYPRNKIETKFSTSDNQIIIAHEEVQAELGKEDHPIRRDARRAKAYIEGMLRLTTQAQFGEFPWVRAENQLNSLLNTIRKEALRGARGSESRSGRLGSSQSGSIRPGSSGGRSGRIVIG